MPTHDVLFLSITCMTCFYVMFVSDGCSLLMLSHCPPNLSGSRPMLYTRFETPTMKCLCWQTIAKCINGCVLDVPRVSSIPTPMHISSISITWWACWWPRGLILERIESWSGLLRWHTYTWKRPEGQRWCGQRLHARAERHRCDSHVSLYHFLLSSAGY